MSNETTDRPDPALDPAVRQRVQRAFNSVLAAAQDVLTRYSRDGVYEAPDPVPFGDVTGLIEVGRNQVIRRLQDQLDDARRVMREVYDELDEHKRQRYGPGYRPLPRDL
jgi:phosphoglycolate phosphatase-like HAD superfamily hydrolase